MKGKRPPLSAIQNSLSKAPPLPETLPAEAFEDWQTAAEDLAERGLLPPSVVPVLEAYIGALLMARKCREAITAHGVLVGAANNSLKPNPAAAILAKANEVIARLAADLGISPSGRSRSGIKGLAHESSESEDPFAEFDL